MPDSNAPWWGSLLSPGGSDTPTPSADPEMEQENLRLEEAQRSAMESFNPAERPHQEPKEDLTRHKPEDVLAALSTAQPDRAQTFPSGDPMSGLLSYLAQQVLGQAQPGVNVLSPADSLAMRWLANGGQ